MANCGLRCGWLAPLSWSSAQSSSLGHRGGRGLQTLSVGEHFSPGRRIVGDEALHTLNPRGTSASHLLQTVSSTGISGDSPHHEGPGAGASPAAPAIPEFDFRGKKMADAEGHERVSQRRRQGRGGPQVADGDSESGVRRAPRAFPALSSPGSGAGVQRKTSCPPPVLTCAN